MPKRIGLIRTIFADAIRTQDCPTCEAEAGDNCEDVIIHHARLEDYIERLGGPDAMRERIRATGRQS